MKIEPCTDDLISIFAIWPVIILCEIGVGISFAWNSLVLWLIILMDCILLIHSMKEYAYFGRTIIFGQEGVVFTLLGFEKRYEWDRIRVTLCNNDGLLFHDSETGGAGVLLTLRDEKLPKKTAAMTYCRYRHPLTSVFLRFQNSKEEDIVVTGKVIYRGYVVEKSRVLNFLTHIGFSL